jgi:hypothetical protein
MLPVVLYTDGSPWKVARSLHQIFRVPQKFATPFPRFRGRVLDLPRMDDKIRMPAAITWHPRTCCGPVGSRIFQAR